MGGGRGKPIVYIEGHDRVIFHSFVCLFVYLCDVILQVFHPVALEKHARHLHAVGARKLVVLNSTRRVADLQNGRPEPCGEG